MCTLHLIEGRWALQSCMRPPDEALPPEAWPPGPPPPQRLETRSMAGPMISDLSRPHACGHDNHWPWWIGAVVVFILWLLWGMR